MKHMLVTLAAALAVFSGCSREDAPPAANPPAATAGSAAVAPPAADSPEPAFDGEVVLLAHQTLAAGEATAVVTVTFPEHFGLNDAAPSRAVIAVTGDALRLPEGHPARTIRKPAFPLRLPLKATRGESQVQATLSLYYCEHGQESKCYVKKVRLTVPVTVAEDAAAREVTLRYEVKP